MLSSLAIILCHHLIEIFLYYNLSTTSTDKGMKLTNIEHTLHKTQNTGFGFLFFFFNWHIVDLQCCASFWCSAKWLGYTCTYSVLNVHPSLIHKYSFKDTSHNLHIFYTITQVNIFLESTVKTLVFFMVPSTFFFSWRETLQGKPAH